VRAALGLGSNLGDRASYLQSAVDALRPVAVSHFIETEPQGGPQQGRYLNAAVVIETDLDPRGLLARVHELEREAGRERAERFGPRTLDVDVLLFGDVEMDEASLTIPHPRMTQRAFVLGPLAEIAPDWVVPGTGRTVGQLHEDLAVGR